MSGQIVTQNWNWRCERFAGFCRRRFPQSTEQHLASLTGIPAPTCRKHLNGEARPGADHMLAYLSVFGPDFARAMLPSQDRWRACDAEKRLEQARLALARAITQLAGAA